MYKKLKFTFAVAVITLLLCLSGIVRATHGYGSSAFTVMVDDEFYELWAYSDGVLSFRLQDMAYMLNGTPAQFDIRTPPDDRWDFWIVRGAPYTPQGTELSLDFEPRYVVFGSYGFISGDGFDSCPRGTVIVGVDGDNEPATAIAVEVIEDPDGTFFDVWSLASLLGISMHWDGYYYLFSGMVFKTDTLAQPVLPIMAPELVDMLLRVGGHWVDYVHFYSQVIDESVVWPMGFQLSTAGFTDINALLAPIQARQNTTWWYPVSMRSLEDGYVELTIDITAQPRLPWDTLIPFVEDIYDPPGDITGFYNHRIIFDASKEHIEEITYFIGETQFAMRRNDWRYGQADPRRYTVGPAEDGGIVLRYVWGSRDYPFIADYEIRIYRSTVHGERGELVERLQNLNPHDRDRLLFEFVDTTVEYGKVYYYSIYTFSERWGRHFRISSVGGFGRQYVVDVNNVLGLPPGFTGVEVEENEYEENLEQVYEAYEAPEPEIIEAALVIESDGAGRTYGSRRHWLWISLLLTFTLLLAMHIVNKRRVR